ncbi:MAG: FAD-binding protein [Hyphomicrobiaceae bacterium]|nr:FAD-binding protein [Hyphomicrobiaceae bacterium]
MRPIDDRECARVFLDALAEGTALDLRGSGSKAAAGRPILAQASVSTRGMRGVTLYEPTEMVMSARAGTLLTQIEQDLANRRQMLAFEPVDLANVCGGDAKETTIGSVFATNASGARRILAGAARDHLLGLNGVNGRGEIFKAGGRVMKNVTGVDLCRGLSGSWGTLALITQVTFKVMPVPAETCSLVLLGLADEFAVQALSASLGTPYEVSGAAHVQGSLVKRLWHEGLREQGEAITAIRLENFPKSIAYRKERLKEALKVYGEVYELEHDNSLAFWGEIGQLSPLQDSTAPLWRISTKPTLGAKLVAALGTYMQCHAYYDWGGGLIWVEVPATSDAGAADIRRVVAMHGGHATLIRAPAEVRGAVDVFQPLEPGVEAITRRLKAAFDPHGLLNPGRMYAQF